MLLDNVEQDYKWYNENIQSYEAEQDRFSLEYKKQLSIHKGELYSKEPLKTKEEIENSIKHELDSIPRLYELNAPESLIELTQDIIEHNMSLLNTGAYIVTEDEKQYRKNYDEHMNSFNFDFKVNALLEYL